MRTELHRVDLRPAYEPAARYLRRPLAIRRAYPKDALRADLLAGLTVGVVMLPQAIAFAVIAALPAPPTTWRKRSTGGSSAIPNDASCCCPGSTPTTSTSP